MAFSKFFTSNKRTRRDAFHGSHTPEAYDIPHTKVRRKRPSQREKPEEQSRNKVRNDQTNSLRQSKNPGNRPSEASLELSSTLKDLSRKKRLDEALILYWKEENKRIRDEHHACIVVDCCARCGCISEGERIVQSMEKDRMQVNVETKTALLKGYAHAGRLDKAGQLFMGMCNSNGRKCRPNIRTANTLLRGCLWSAVNVKENGTRYGGVVTSELVWKRCIEMQTKERGVVHLDLSSYEYTISILCQALRVDEAEARLLEMKSLFSVDGSDKASLMESLAMAYISLARAYVVLQNTDMATTACNSTLLMVETSRKSTQEGKSAGTRGQGKRAWRQESANKDSRRTKSNSIFREHRLAEVEGEARFLKDLSEKCEQTEDFRQLARRLLTRLLVISGGGTTEIDSLSEGESSEKASANDIQQQLVNTAYFSYGLNTVLQKLGIEFDRNPSFFLRRNDCNRILGSIGLQGGVLEADGFVDFSRIFMAGVTPGAKKRKLKTQKRRMLDIELGSGFGDWIVKKAMLNQERDFVSVELRADRVGQAFARAAALSSSCPVDNLCFVGAEGGPFLRNHVRPDSVATIFVNHPEPPTQTFGSDETVLNSIMDGMQEPGHMLTSNVLESTLRCLSKTPDSMLVIVTDNLFYGRLICATLVTLERRCPDLLSPIELSSLDRSFTVCDSFPVVCGEICLFEGQPNATIRHQVEGTEDSQGASYFDRLWRSGASTHASRKKRYIVTVARGR